MVYTRALLPRLHRNKQASSRVGMEGLTNELIPNACAFLEVFDGHDDAVDEGNEDGLVIQCGGRIPQFLHEELEAVPVALPFLQGEQKWRNISCSQW